MKKIIKKKGGGGVLLYMDHASVENLRITRFDERVERRE